MCTTFENTTSQEFIGLEIPTLFCQLLEHAHFLQELRCYHEHHVSLDLRWVIYGPIEFKVKTMEHAYKAIR